MTYRADVDGLRAISVIAVILFHARIPGFPGGYAGVDVFFVISGYLITQILVARRVGSLGATLADFYLRRARRILPALLVMLIAVLCAAMCLVLPRDLQFLGKTLAFAALMLGNFGAWLNVGYFTAQGANAALIHLWSLGVEEQFYLLYPVALLLILRFSPGRARSVVAAGALASLACSIYASYWSPAANFYLMPTRGWELGAGAWLALGPVPAIIARHARPLALAGLGAILATFVLANPQVRWPGVATLPVVLGAALLLATPLQSPTPVARGLSWRPLVFTGLISYSLYLWHAPVLMLFEYYTASPAGIGTRALLIAVPWLLAVASWRWIERPLRERRALRSQPLFLGVVASVSLALAIAGVFLYRSDGLPQRFPPAAQKLLDPANLFFEGGIACMSLAPERIARGELCRFGAANADAPRMVLWGDSHALALLPAYESLARQRGFALYFAGKSSCAPLFEPAPPPSFEVPRVQCERFNQVMQHGVAQLRPDVVVLSGFWRAWRSRYIDATGDWDSELAREYAGALAATVRQVHASAPQVCVVRDVPQLSFGAMDALALASIRGTPAPEPPTRAEAERQQRPIDAAIEALARAGAILVADPAHRLCDGRCRIVMDHVALYRDSSHLTLAGARYVQPALDSCFAGSAPPVNR